MRELVLDTETTGLETKDGHRIIEVACVELNNRRITGKHFHAYYNPERAIDEAAQAVHGLTAERLAPEPRFAEKIDALWDFLQGSERIVIHNAPFDLGFLAYEFQLAGKSDWDIARSFSVLDSLKLARERHPGQKNNLDALCKRYNVDNTQRRWHGALLDAELLALVYLAMTGGQSTLFGEERGHQSQSLSHPVASKRARLPHVNLPVILANAEELAAHEAYFNS